MRCTTILCLCGLLLVSLTAQAKSPKGSELPFHLYWNYLVVVEGSIGDWNKRNFLIDTGANPSMLDQRIADRLGLNGPAEKLPVLNGEVNIRRVSVPALRLGPLTRDTVEMGVQDLSFLERDLGVRIDALIGLDVLSERSFHIDYAAKRLRFDDQPAGAGAASFASGPPFVTVEMQMENQPVRLLVDTGASGLILFGGPVASQLRELPPTAAANGASITGRIRMREVQITNARLGNTDLGSRRAFVAEHRKTDDFDGLLGISPLNVREISFDFEHRLLTWQPRDSGFTATSNAGLVVCTSAGPGAMSSSPAKGLVEPSRCTEETEAHRK